MMYSRLTLARTLLSDDGVIFISIDDNEAPNIRKICSEVFGDSNFIAEFPRVTKRGGKSTSTFAKNHDYVVAFCKNASSVSISGVAHIDAGFKYKDEFYEQRGPYKLNQTLDYNTLQYNKTMDYIIEIDGIQYVPGSSMEKHNLRHSGVHGNHDWVWRWSKALFDYGYKNGWIVVSSTGRIYTKTYLKASIVKDNNGNYCIEYKDRSKSISTVETTENRYSNDNATKEIKAVLGESYFEYAKPTSLINLFLSTCSESDSIILDFFSGSATTAHAVMQLNAEDGGHRRFIMVQYPEKCDEKSEAYKAGYSTIAEIGKERIRRAGKKIVEESGLAAGELDVGFRVLKCDSSNMKDVYYAAGEYSQGLLTDAESNIKEDRTDIDLLFGCLIDWGLPLSMPYTSEKIGDCTVHTYNDGDLIACFDDNIPDDVVKEIAKRQPLRAVFRDRSFRNSPSKINVGEIFKLIAPNTSVKVI